VNDVREFRDAIDIAEEELAAMKREAL